VIAALYTTEFPDKVNKLVLVSPAPSIRFPIDPNDDIDNIMSKSLSAQTNTEFEKYKENLWNPEHVLKMNEEELSIQNRRFFYFYDEYHKNIGLPNSVELIDDLVDKNTIGGWLPYGYAWSFPNTFDYRNNLKAITSPTLILWGDKDITKESWAKDYSRYIPFSKVVMISNVGHFMFEENPAAFANAINDFLRE
jgi:pimeloyl-ACP methyl ester carboxylesterase